MLYFLLGLLSIIALQSILFMQYYERGYRINKKHMFFSVIFSLYMIYVIEFLHDKIIHMNTDLIMIMLLFIPVGMLMPMIYRRYRNFLLVMVYTVLMDILIFILQNLAVGRINLLVLLFSFVGVLFGFFAGTVLNRTFPEFRKSIILKKRKKKILFALYEIELVTICFAALFMMISMAENISGKNLNKKLKDTISYSHNGDDKRWNIYVSIYYADEDKYERYESYAGKHPDMSVEEVVWRVDANLDKEFYDEEYTKYADADTDKPLLINKFNRVSEDFEPYRLIKIEGDYEATPETVSAYKRLIEDLEAEGMKIYVVSAYRSVAYQKRLHNYYLKSDEKEVVETYSARPGYSEHHTGRALDVSQVYNNLDAFEGSDEADWVYKNAYKYGFIVRYKASQTDVTGYIFEPWHIVYVGEEISRTMHDENIETLEEYVVKYIDHVKP